MTQTDQPEWMQGFVPQPAKWVKGMPSPNPAGRPAGVTPMALMLKQMMEEGSEVVAVQIAKAKTGDTGAAQLILSRILPSLRNQMQTVQFPFDASAPITTQIEAVLAAVAAGEVAPDVGQQIIAAINMLSQARVTEELAAEVAALKAKDITP